MKNFWLLLFSSCLLYGSDSTKMNILDDPIFSISDGQENSPALQKPSCVLVTEDGFVYVLDRAMMVVYKFKMDGTLVKTIGGKGQGPGEFYQPHGMAISGDFLWITDYGNGRLQLFKNDEFVKVIKSKIAAPKNIMNLGDEIFVCGPAVDKAQGPITVFTADGNPLRELPWSQSRNQDRGRTRSLWNRISLEPLTAKQILVGYQFDNVLEVIDTSGEQLKEFEMENYYGVHQSKKGDVTFPEGYAAMSFSAGPQDSILVAVCDHEKRSCDTVLRFDAKGKLIQRIEGFGSSVSFMRYFEDLKMLALTKKNTEINIYAID